MFPVGSAYHLPLSPVTSAGSAGDTFADSASSAFTSSAGNTSASNTLLSFITSSGPLSTVLGHFSSLVAGGGRMSAVSDCFLSSVTDGDLSSTISGCPSSSVAGSNLLFAVSDCLLSPISGSSPLSLVLLISFRGLFLTSTPSCVHCSSLPSSPLFRSFLPSLPTPLTHNPTPFTRKRLFDQVFITQRLITSI